MELVAKRALAATSSVDFGLYGFTAEDNLDALEGLIAAGATAFKCFIGNTFGDLPAPSTGAMLEGFQIIARSGLRISLLAEEATTMARR